MAMTHMARSPQEKAKEIGPLPVETEASAPDYPDGLCLRLTAAELEKLGLDMPEKDDAIAFDVMAVVKETMHHDGPGGEHCCVVLQITHIGLEDDEDEPEENPRKNAMKRYENGDDDDGEE